MRQLLAFTKKEGMELVRTGKLLIMTIIFILFGIMNPAIAKLTPWLMDMVSDSMEDVGVMVTEVTVDAMTSWTQFYKNVPMACIIFLLLFGSIVTAEYQKGTLIHMITKGLERWKVMAAKGLAMTAAWTCGYWLCYGITYGYNAWFWDNKIASYLVFAAFCLYLIGVWLISLLLLMSAVLDSGSGVLAAAGGAFLAVYLVSLIPAVEKYMPVYLMRASGLLGGIGKSEEYLSAVGVTVVLSALNFAAAVVCFNRRNI